MNRREAMTAAVAAVAGAALGVTPTVSLIQLWRSRVAGNETRTPPHGWKLSVVEEKNWTQIRVSLDNLNSSVYILSRA